MGAVGEGEPSIHPGLAQGLGGQYRGDHIGAAAAQFLREVQSQDAELAQPAKGLVIEFPFQIVFLTAGNNLFPGEFQHLFLEKKLLFGERKIHVGSDT